MSNLNGKVLAILGNAGSGKDTAAKMICEIIPGAATIAFADPMKHFCKEVFKFSDAQLWGPSEERNRPDPRYIREDGEVLTARTCLQWLGTDFGRRCCPDIWVNYALDRATKMLDEGCPLVIITDCRFINEAQKVRSVGGWVWKIQRNAMSNMSVEARTHKSEQDQNSQEIDGLVDAFIPNHGTLEELRGTLQTLLRS